MFVRVVYELLRLLLRYDVVLLASLLVFVPLLKFRKNGGYLFAVLVAVYIAVPTAYHYCNNGEELWMYAGFQVANWYSICYIVYWLFAMLILFACFRVSVTDVLFYGTAAYTLQNFSHNIRAIVRAVAFGGAWSLLSCSVMFCIEAAILRLLNLARTPFSSDFH